MKLWKKNRVEMIEFMNASAWYVFHSIRTKTAGKSSTKQEVTPDSLCVYDSKQDFFNKKS